MWHFTCTLHTGRRIDFPGTSLMSITPDGQISHEIALWSLADVPYPAAADLGLHPAVSYQVAVKTAADGRGTSAARPANSYWKSVRQPREARKRA